MFDLTGKTALVTGASSGLGRHFAAVLARAGARVALAARRIEALEDLRDELAAGGAEAFALRMDVTDEASVVAAVGQMARDFAPPDILVNNSGVSGEGLAISTTGDQWDAVMDVNLKGAFLVARECAKGMAGRGNGGSIVNIASITGLGTTAGLAAYSASKAGLIHLTKVLALEWSRHAIRVNAIAPGYFPTEINAGFWDTEPGKAMLRRIPMRRLGKLSELDAPLLLLAGDDAGYMTGSVLAIDGGHLCEQM